MTPHSREFAESAWLPFIHDMAGAVGITMESSPLNLSFFLAVFCCVAFWILIWRTRRIAIRVVGRNERAAVYAGINPARTIMLTMAISGALAVGSGQHGAGHIHRLLLDFPEGLGFTGIAGR